MNRPDESESTPKKRTLKQDESVVREATTKSGRKIKRPAHLDSPERAPSASPSEARKSMAVRAKKTVEPSAGTPGKRTATKEQISPKEAKGARKTIASTRKTISEHLDTPQSNKEKKQMANTVDDAAGISKSGRKIKIPTKLMEFESDVLSSPRKNAAADQDVSLKDKLTKTPGRSKTPAKSTVKNVAVEQNQHPDDDDDEEKKLAVRKTPGRRAKSVAPDQLEVETVRTPKRRGVSSLFGKDVQKESSASEQAHSKTPGKRAGKTLIGLDVKASPKTPGRRAKSVAPLKEEKDDTHLAQNVLEKDSKTYKNATQTPGRRVGKSVLDPAAQSSHCESLDSVQAVPKTPGRRPAKAMTDANVTSLAVESPRSQRALTKTPGGRQKSVAVDKTDSVEAVPSKGKTGERKLEDNDNLRSEAQIADTEIETKSSSADSKTIATEESLSRSGRKIKPKKMFDYEQDEKSTDPTSTNENVSIDSRRKRKVDNTDESAKTPIKKKVVENVGAETPKLKSQLESNPSALGTESPQMENPTDGSVSRSGRKIKPKKMFGFDNGVETTTSFVHITGSSPTLSEEVGETSNKSTMDSAQKDTRSVEIKTASTPSKRAASLAGIVKQKTTARPMEIDQKVEELFDSGVLNQQQTSITTRDGNDHHHAPTRVREEQQHLIDETDHAMVSSEPMIIRTSIGFGKPKAQKQTLSEVTGVLEPIDRSKVNEIVTPSRAATDEQAVGSSRSGRKIKPKKFFDTEDVTTTSRQSVVSTKTNQPDPVPTASNQPIVENQENEELRKTASLDENAKNPTNGNGGEQNQQEKVTVAGTDHNDVAMEQEEKLQDVKVEQDKVVIDNERSITMKEEFSAQLAQEKNDVPDDTMPEEGKCNELLTDNNSIGTNSDGSAATVQLHPDDVAVTESSLDMDVKQTSLAVDASVKGADLPVDQRKEDGGNDSIDKTANESNASIEIPHEVLSTSVADIKSEEESKVVHSENVSTLSETPYEEMVEEASYGSIEYLEDEMSNIVEHIKKPAIQEPTTVSTNVSASGIPSIVIVKETPVRITLNETYSPAKKDSSIIDITADTPGPVAAAPRTPDSKLAAQEANDKCSPDKPPEVIEIMDSPAVAAFCKQINDVSAHCGDGGSATSTPLVVKPSVVQLANDCEEDEQRSVQFESRKRSLSASAADTTMKRNVTFHSPANCTMLVETIDERLMLKSLQEQQQQRHETMETSSKSIGEKLRKPRKRSLSEHKPSDMKRNKSSKLPNFKSIHANHFNRMESLGDFLKRKETRAKHILSSCSPATKVLAQPITDASGTAAVSVPSVEKKIPSSSTKPFIFKSAGGGIPVPSAGLFVKRTKEGPTAAKSAGSSDRHALSAIAGASTARKPIASDTERMANRLKQFQTTFKPKQIGSDTTAAPMSGSLASTSSNAVGERPVEQLRTKQSKILKGVRTNRRFELQMKHRDNQQHQ